MLFLDDSPELNARAHLDCQLAGAITELAKLVGDVVQCCGMEDSNFYEAGDADVELVAWAAETRGNFLHVVGCLVHLISEHDHRYGAAKRSGEAKFHRARMIAAAAVALCSVVPAGDMTAPPQLVPGDFQGPQTIAAHRAYHRWRAEQLPQAWTRRERPEWW